MYLRIPLKVRVPCQNCCIMSRCWSCCIGIRILTSIWALRLCRDGHAAVACMAVAVGLDQQAGRGGCVVCARDLATTDVTCSCQPERETQQHMDALLQAPLFLFLRRAAMERLPTLTALFAGVIVFFWMVRSRSCICRPYHLPAPHPRTACCLSRTVTCLRSDANAEACIRRDQGEC